MKRLPLGSGRVMLVAAAFAACGGSASASQVDLSAYVNSNLNTYFDGSVYPPNGGPETIAGIAFNLTPLPLGGTGVIQGAYGHPDSYVIAVGEAGVQTVYTVANSAFGQFGADVGSLTFTGSGGSSYVYTFHEGTNIRDHATTFYNDVATDLYGSKDYGDGDHLDVQKISLPAAFASETLVSITFTAADSGGGDPFLAAINTSAAAVPEPASWSLMLLGLGGLGLALRRDASRRFQLARGGLRAETRAST